MDHYEQHRFNRGKHELLTEAATAVEVTLKGLATFLLASGVCMKVGGMDVPLETEALLAAGSAATLAIAVPFGRFAVRHSQQAEALAPLIEEHDPRAYSPS